MKHVKPGVISRPEDWQKVGPDKWLLVRYTPLGEIKTYVWGPDQCEICGEPIDKKYTNVCRCVDCTNAYGRFRMNPKSIDRPYLKAILDAIADGRIKPKTVPR